MTDYQHSIDSTDDLRTADATDQARVVASDVAGGNTRRGVLKTLGATATVGGLVVGSAQPAAADHNGNCTSDLHGDEVKITEFNGSTVEYWITTENGAWWNCYEGSLESNDEGSVNIVNGTVNDGTDKWFLSGGGIVEIELDDKGSNGSVGVELTMGHDHCAADYSRYAPVQIDGHRNEEAYYDFCMTGDVEPGSNLESNDSEYWGSCADGYIYDQTDEWDGWGRFQHVSVRTNGNYVEVNRFPHYSEC